MSRRQSDGRRRHPRGGGIGKGAGHEIKVHYYGWKSKWDEWLLSRSERLLPRHQPDSLRAQWQPWRLGGRLNRLNFTLQTIALAAIAVPLAGLASKAGNGLALATLLVIGLALPRM